MNKLVGPYHDLLVNLHAQCTHRLPTALYPTLLKEAIYNREPVAIETLISRWPLPILKVFDVIPEEDYIEPEYLTLAFEGHGNTCILDCILLGLLKLRPESKLRFVDFTSFEKGKHFSLTLNMLLVANLVKTKMMQKTPNITETLAYGYSSESTQPEPSNEYQHDRV